MDKEVAQVKEDLGKLSLETIGEGLNEVIEGKMEEVERRLVKCVETQCEKQGVLLREQWGEDIPPRGGSCPGGAGVTGRRRRVARCGGVHAKLGEGRDRGPFGLMRVPSMTVPVGVQSASPMAWESKRDDAGHGQTRTGVVDPRANGSDPAGVRHRWDLGGTPLQESLGNWRGRPQKGQGCH